MNKAQTADPDMLSKWQAFISADEFDHPDIQSDSTGCWESVYLPAAGSNKNTTTPFNSGEIARANIRNTDLVDVVLPVMVDIYESLKGSGFQVLLTDENGLVVKRIPVSESPLFDNWDEQILGANAIGTVIRTKKPMQISGRMHYQHKLRSLTSSAIPIFSYHRELIAVLALVGPKNEDHSHVLTMLQKAAENIINKWNIVQKNRQLLTYNNHLKNIINTMTDGIIIISDTGIIEQANPAAARILGKDTRELSATHLGTILENQPFLNKMLDDGIPFTDMELFLDISSGRIHCLASGQTSRDDKGNITGGIIVLRSIDKVQRMVNSVWGTRAEVKFKDIIGNGRTIRTTIEMARIAANNMSNVLLQGESGTGKEIFAQAIHNESTRCKGPFVAVNCGAIPRELVGSELFGYVDGAFTGARRGGKLGKFEMAAGGTLFLDEIGDMPLDQQVVLLRVLQDKLVTRIGDSKEIPVDVRVICATNKNLLREVEKGNFRQDLYYRLNVISIIIPPLCNRREDIGLLVNHYLVKLGVQDNTISNVMNPAVMQYLISYSWPGNVRELQNAIERLAIIADTRHITVADLPHEIRLSKNNFSSEDEPASDLHESYTRKKKQLIAEQESEQILTMLRKLRGNLSEVAKAMGFSRTTLYRKLEAYNISRDSW